MCHSFSKTVGGYLMCAILTMFAPSKVVPAKEPGDSQKRLIADIQFLTADAAREGRSVGRRGLDLAADYIGRQFAESGLLMTSCGGTPFQKFVSAVIVKMGPDNHLALVGPPREMGQLKRIELVLGRDYIPLAIGGSGKLDSPLIFAGYGVSDARKQYDDYAGLDFAGSTPIMFMGFDRPEVVAIHKQRLAKIRQLKASGLIFVRNESLRRKDFTAYRKAWEESLQRLSDNLAAIKKNGQDEAKIDESQMKDLEDAAKSVFIWQERQRDTSDLQLKFDSADWTEIDPGIPVVRFSQTIVNRIFQSVARTDLQELERQIDAEKKPRSIALKGWSVVGKVDVRRQFIEAKNVIAVLEGSGPLADETIIVGAHYDARPDIPERRCRAYPHTTIPRSWVRIVRVPYWAHRQRRSVRGRMTMHRE